MTYQWPEKPNKPNCPGLWAQKQGDRIDIATIYDEDGWQSTWPGFWCRIGDLPTIVDPPRYRPVTAADVGKIVEVRDHENDAWQLRELLAILPEGFNGKFIVQSTGSSTGWIWFCRARILDSGDDGQKREAREWWIELNECNGFSNWSRKKLVGTNGREIVHVREVID